MCWYYGSRSKYLIIEGAHEALEEILDNMNPSSTKSKETNIYPVFERLTKENSCHFMKRFIENHSFHYKELVNLIRNIY